MILCFPDRYECFGFCFLTQRFSDSRKRYEKKRKFITVNSLVFQNPKFFLFLLFQQTPSRF
ncbi:hypothetical protein CH380_10435 [Leptospira adleri]|uniref:Uncharacterized protein n=1 Tax=Leptospira adleri TaxID=2023186 RepID=A0A2M9YNZ0_9LEPT|nr:hypothetical protein CH380_10435 [Leptospira adleri]PJZ63973.1 hypothetical protein CH376_00675 [Leptospira adleri]